MTKNYVITFSAIKGDLNFKDIPSFIKWIFDNKNLLEKNNFEIKSEIKDIDAKYVYDVLDFIKHYLKVKKSLDNEMNVYNKDLRKLNSTEDLKKAISEFIRLNSGGKFLRATLLSLGYKSMGNTDEKYIDLALALEIFQTSILIHDDIIDSANVRRGKDTIQASYNKLFKTKRKKDFIVKRNNFSNSMALCIGDLGFYLANGLIVNSYKNHPRLSDVLSYYNDMVIKTCAGEMMDIILPFKEEFYDTDKKIEEKVIEIYKLKTAWYSVIGPYCLGMILGGASLKQIRKMEDILLNVGIAFQIKDDLLGIYGDDKYIGKSTNSDIEEYKQTILYAHAVKTKYKDELLKYYGKNDLSKKQINKVKDIFELSGSKKYAEDMMNKLFKDSLIKISRQKFIDRDIKKILIGFIIYLENRLK